MQVSEAPAPAATVAATRPRAPARVWWGWIAVALLMAVGVAVRIAVARDSLFADELSTFWIVTAHGPRGVLSTVHSDAEITPPLYFAAAWLTTQLGHGPLLVRLPSLVAGTLTIPAMHALGL